VVADSATSLRRGVDVLNVLAGDKALGSGGLGVLQIAELVGSDKSQVSRTLKILAEYGLVDRDPQTRAYRLGWSLFALAARAGDTQLLAAGETVVKELVRTLDERAHLTVLQGTEVLTVLSSSPGHAIEAAGWVGRLVPAYCSSSGRALLLDHTPAELRELLGKVRFLTLGPDAPRSLPELAERIELARARGYATVDEEFEPGLVAAAAPVRDFRGRIVAALNVSGPKFRLGARLEEAGIEAARAAEALSNRLGWKAQEPVSARRAELP
jgi:IclR family transcriptional regulator, KDG regulon repressor